MDWSKDRILAVLDDCCDAFTFPILDNGYVYLAGTRLSAFLSPKDWGLVIEVFGFHTRSDAAETAVYTFGSRIANRKSPEQFVTPKAHANYLAANPYNDMHFVFPIEDGVWQDQEDVEMINVGARNVTIRGSVVPVPTGEECRMLGIELEDAPRIHVFEFCRALAAVHRDDILATPSERRFMLPDGLDSVLQLEEWHHPNVVDPNERPSGTETLIQLADVLVSGDVTQYRPSLPPNTHWSNWPGAGRL